MDIKLSARERLINRLNGLPRELDKLVCEVLDQQDAEIARLRALLERSREGLDEYWAEQNAALLSDIDAALGKGEK